jgi:hypothetical protein
MVMTSIALLDHLIPAALHVMKQDLIAAKGSLSTKPMGNIIIRNAW